MRSSIALVVLLAACGDSPCDPGAPNTICTIAGAGAEVGYAGDGGPATRATLYMPVDTLIVGGEVWILDFNNYVIRAIDARGTIRTVVGNGVLGDSPASDQLPRVPALEASGNHTTHAVVDGDYVYLAAWHESRVKRVRLSDMTMELFAGRGVRGQYTGDGGPASDAAFDLPSALAFDPSGRLVVTDAGNQVVRAIDPNGTVETIAGQCLVEDTPCAAPAACPGSGRLTCGDPATTCMYSACQPAFAGDGGPARTARFAMPVGDSALPAGGIAFDRAGTLIFCDTNNNRVRAIDPSGTIRTIAGTGTPGAGGDGGPATAAELSAPVDVAIGDDGSIYVAELLNNCIRKIDRGGTISTVVGTCGAPRGFAGDGGSPSRALLANPFGIDLAGTKLYISDTRNNRVRVANLAD